jgi:hypothetical protein
VEKADEVTGESFQRSVKSASLFYLAVSIPPPALEVTWDLDKEESRDGRSGNGLWTGLTGCDGAIDEQPREEFFSLAFPLLSLARTKSRGS